MKMFNWLKPCNWGIVKVYRDFENFSDWGRVIRKEESNINSLFNKWKLKRTKLYDVYLSISLDEEDTQLPESVQRTKIVEQLNPLHRYLDDDLGFAECLNCEFNQFEDDKKNPTLTYLIVYRFNFNKFSIIWLTKFLVVTFALIYFGIKYIPTLIPWLSTLI